MAFFTRVLYQLSLFDSTVAFLEPRASGFGYLLRPLPSLALLGRCCRRACRPRASDAGYLCARSPRLPLLGRCRRRACRPRASVAGYLCARSPRLPSLGRCRRRACCPRALVAGYLGARSPRLPSLGRCCRRVYSPPRLSRRLPFAPAPLYCARLFFHFSSTKRKENRCAAMQDTQVAIRIEQQTTHYIDPRITRSMRSKLKSRCRLV